MFEQLAPNFIGSGDGFRYARFSHENIADYINRIGNATEHLFRCLEHFMANATDDDYRDMGITNPQLIRLIRMSWEADEKYRHIQPALFNGLSGNFDYTIDTEGQHWIYEYNANIPVLTMNRLSCSISFISACVKSGKAE